MPKNPSGWHCFHCGAGGNAGGFCTMCGGGSGDFVKRDKEHCRKCGSPDVRGWHHFCPQCGVREPLSGEYAFAIHDAIQEAGLTEAEAAVLIRASKAKAA